MSQPKKVHFNIIIEFCNKTVANIELEILKLPKIITQRGEEIKILYVNISMSFTKLFTSLYPIYTLSNLTFFLFYIDGQKQQQSVINISALLINDYITHKQNVCTRYKIIYTMIRTYVRLYYIYTHNIRPAFLNSMSKCKKE